MWNPTTGATGNKLDLIRRYPLKKNSDYPLAGRFDRDATGSYPIFGFPCSNNWCFVGREGFTVNQGDNETGAKEEVVRGWYDEQRLSKLKTGMAIPSNAVGTVWPKKDLIKQKDVEFVRNWVDVATAQLSEDDADYKDKYTFTKAARTTISICQRDAQQCPGSTENCGMPSDPNGSKGWVARFSQGADTKYRCLNRKSHGDSPPGVVRWYWNKNDEGLWIRCGFGCCKIS
jgi:hypothetical protein